MNREPGNPPEFESFEWEDQNASEIEEVAGWNNLPAWPSADEPLPPPSAIDDRDDRSNQEVHPASRENSRQNALTFQSHGSNAMFAYLVVIALSLGLTPLAATLPVERYAILWTLLAGFLIGTIITQKESVIIRIGLNDLLWGGGWGLALGALLLLVGAGLLAEASERIFVNMPDGAVFLIVVFVMAPVETFFFRYSLQQQRSILVAALLASVWSILLFFPTMDVIRYPFVSLIVGTFLIMLNALYSRLRQRNGLAAAWVCQTVVSLAWLFIPRLLV